MKNFKRLKNHSGCNCKIYEDAESITFVSYVTRVIEIKKDTKGNRMIECTGTYSPTTARQITYFLREYAPDLCLSDMKKIAYKGFVRI